VFEQVLRHNTRQTLDARLFTIPSHPEWGVRYRNWVVTPLPNDHGHVAALLFEAAESNERAAREESPRMNRAAWFFGRWFFESRRAGLTLLLAVVAQFIVFFSVDRFGQPSNIVGIPGAASALLSVLAAVSAGLVAGTIVALAGGVAFYLSLADLGQSQTLTTVMVSTLLWILAALAAGLAGMWIRRRSEIRERLLESEADQRQELLTHEQQLAEQLSAANETLRARNSEIERNREGLYERHQELLRLHSDVQESARLRQALISVSEDLMSALDVDEVLRRSVAKGVEALGADPGALEVRVADGWVIQSVFGVPQDLMGVVLTDAEASLAMLIVEEQGPLLVADIRADPRASRSTFVRYGMISALVVPILVKGKVSGALLIGHSGQAGFFDESHMEFARNLSALIALTAENARLYEHQASMVRLLEEALLDIPEDLSGVEFGHLYRSASEQSRVGGDFYDVIQMRNGWIGILIGDVSGHGVEAARVATLARDTIQAFAHQSRHPRLVLAETNRVLVDRRIKGFVTAFLCFLDPLTGGMVYSSAGHPPPLLVEGGSVRQLEPGGSPLGSFAVSRYTDRDAVIAKDSILLLYTDGVTEARRGNELYGESRLEAALLEEREGEISDLPARLLARVTDFSGGLLQDDVAMLAVCYTGERKGSVAQDVSLGVRGVVVKAVVDRFEDDKAVLVLGGGEDILIIRRSELPPGVCEGQCLQVEIRDGALMELEIHEE
jgi:serine phosphatase RsbU (regulator of sigma subunit)